MVEDLKHLDDGDWDTVKDILQLKKLQVKKLDAAIKKLNLIEFDPDLAQPIPINASNDTGKSMPKPKSKRHLHIGQGGNLKKIDEAFGSVTSIDLTKDSSDDESPCTDNTTESQKCVSTTNNTHTTVLGLIGSSSRDNWREHRSKIDVHEAVKTLDDVAPIHERVLWKLDTVKHHQLFQKSQNKEFLSTSNNIQDFHGYYKVLGPKFSRETQSEELEKAYTLKKSWFRSESQKYHPDRNPTDPNAKTKWEEIWKINEHVEKAHDILCGNIKRADDIGRLLSSRFWYDSECDLLRSSWQCNSLYDDSHAKEEYEKNITCQKISKSKKTPEQETIIENVFAYTSLRRVYNRTMSGD